jgi:hypothetical protein
MNLKLNRRQPWAARDEPSPGAKRFDPAMLD